MLSDPLLPPDSDPTSMASSSGSMPLSSGATQTTSTGLAPNVAAGLATVLTIITGIVFIVLEKRNQFVRFWAMQSIFFGGAAIIFNIISTILAHILGPLAILWALVSLVVSLGFLIVWSIMMIKAFTGQTWEVPVLGKMARAQLAKPPIL